MTQKNEQIQIKKLEPDDWVCFKAIRLEALRAHPDFFCPSRDEFAFGESDWRERLNNRNAANFGVFDGEVMVGMTGVYRESQQANSAHLVGSYLRQEYRRRGISALMYEIRIAWAIAEGISRLCVEHHENNHASHRAHQKYGFKQVRRSPRIWPNGESAQTIQYELKLGL